jgi:hypothetical protein
MEHPAAPERPLLIQPKEPSSGVKAIGTMNLPGNVQADLRLRLHRLWLFCTDSRLPTDGGGRSSTLGLDGPADLSNSPVLTVTRWATQAGRRVQVQSHRAHFTNPGAPTSSSSSKSRTSPRGERSSFRIPGTHLSTSSPMTFKS